MSDQNDINKKLDELKQEADEYKREGIVRVGDHEVKVVAGDNGGISVKPTTFDKFKRRAENKARETVNNVFIPYLRDLAYNTLDDFAYRLIFRDSDDTPVRNGGTRRKSYAGFTDYGYKSTGWSTGWSTARSARSASSSREDPYSQEDAEIYRSIILPNIGDVENVFREVNRVMEKYGYAFVSDAYVAAKQSNKINDTDLNYGWSIDRYPNGIPTAWDRMNGRDKDNRPITVFRCRFPEPEDIDND